MSYCQQIRYTDVSEINCRFIELWQGNGAMQRVQVSETGMEKFQRVLSVSNQSFTLSRGPAGAIELGDGGDLGSKHRNDDNVDKR